MKVTKTNRHSALALLGLLSVFYAFGQEKLKERFDVVDGAAVHLNTSHTDVIFESWNKDVVAVQAYVVGEGLSKSQLDHVLDAWEVRVSGHENLITIAASKSKKHAVHPDAVSVNRQGNMRAMTELGPMLSGMLAPMMHAIAQNPIPAEWARHMEALQFDYVAYERNGQQYMANWEKNTQSNADEKIVVAIEQWGRQFEQDAKNWNKSLELQMKVWSTQFEQDMQRWGGSLHSSEYNVIKSRSVGVGVPTTNSGGYMYEVAAPVKVDRVLKVYVPKTAQLKLNVRHGEVALTNQLDNVNASLSHAQLAAHIIDGSATRIHASYSPIYVKHWKEGVLLIDYVKNCRIENAEAIRLKTNSSNVYIQNMKATGLITGNFGSITIANMHTDFSRLDLNLRNSDLRITLPPSAFNLTYLGSRSLIQLPKFMDIRTIRNFGNESITGFYKSRNTESAITINAKYSDIALQ